MAAKAFTQVRTIRSKLSAGHFLCLSVLSLVFSPSFPLSLSLLSSYLQSTTQVFCLQLYVSYFPAPLSLPFSKTSCPLLSRAATHISGSPRSVFQPAHLVTLLNASACSSAPFLLVSTPGINALYHGEVLIKENSFGGLLVSSCSYFGNQKHIIHDKHRQNKALVAWGSPISHKKCLSTQTNYDTCFNP